MSTSSSTSAFTVSQWHELEHQALIFKYLKAGLPVPPDLLVPIRRSLQLISSSLFHHPALGYYGKKIDPEPGRCRRTDGKKWRCSKDAHPDSKYCERHMNRSRYRSRKPVESQIGTTAAQNPITDSTNLSRSPYWITNKDYRCVQGLKPEVDDDVLPIAYESVRSFGINSSADGAWHLTASENPSNRLLDQRNGALLQTSCSTVQMLQDFDPMTTDAAISKQQQRYFFGREFGSPRSAKQENQSLQSLPNELPKTIDFGYYLDDQRANKNSSSTTQLSMSIPVASSEFFARSSHSSKDASLEKFLS
ncbi:growth-regulating factor 4-like isoform X2 [Pistacia vera]|uniref:growth-regulating factor 4-like isoform X2 n=1 Tax=Pistacia vera TaxID=55513 RepID=UPI001263D3E2|nr:growth-regulating factor 4-like isoform X2 [Pistacia vera]